MSEPARKTPLYVTMEEPITIGMLCRCLLALLVGGLLGLSLFTLGAQLDAKEVDSSAVACVVLSCLLIPSMASSQETAHPAGRVLPSCRLNRLSVCGRVTGEPIRRYEHDHLGSPVRVEVKNLGSIPEGGG